MYVSISDWLIEKTD